MLKKIKITDIEKIEIVVTKHMNDSEVYAKYKPSYMLNLALYDTKTGSNIVHMKDNETGNSGYLFSDVGLGITQNNNPIWISKEEAMKNNEVKDYCSFSPVLVQKGKKDIQWGNKYSSYVDGNHHRSFMGLNEEYLFIGVSDNKNTIEGLANYCVSQGMKYAGNNDGNGSTSLWEFGKALKKSSRDNASWLLIWLKEKEDINMTTSKIKIMLNGVEKEVEAINKNNTNYVKLRDIADNKIIVDYDSVKKMPVVKVVEGNKETVEETKPIPPTQKNVKICLDAGHNKVYTGANGFGLQEHEVVLKIALKVGELLAENGVGVVFTRTTNEKIGNTKGLDLQKRCDIANKNKCDYFISIHNNAFSDPNSNGIETLLYSDKDSNTLAFATSIQRELIKATGLRDRGLKYRQDLTVLKGTSMSAILCEINFISNKKENDLLKSEQYLDKCAKAISDGVIAHIESKNK